ncbi:MAG: Release factor glutamine methyltransferase [Cellvibrionales bacterium UBA7375]|nr:protein-(glutamine-N5) methyltransferase, release factor-specific [Gammaproteobacteria bacterium]CAI8160015.1 MAG: Release factor glutamine methyltransferase [Cellvibrionales bacterium UBA7375]
MANVSELLQLSAKLQPTSDSPQLDCELLLCHVLDVDRTWLRTWPEKQVSSAQKSLFISLLDQRFEGMPIAYLVGSRGFWSMDLKVSSDTLIPRPETELLIEMALNLNLPRHSCGLDLGTGTGAIALALASERQDMQWIAVDSQSGAVELAKANCDHQQLANVTIFQSSWFDALKATNNTFDLIVSNPPYIAANDPHLVVGDVRFEPPSALVSGADGLDDIKIIISQSSAYLNTNGWLVIEHGYNQRQAVRDLMCAAGFSKVATQQDYNHLDRVTLGQYK